MSVQGVGRAVLLRGKRCSDASSEGGERSCSLCKCFPIIRFLSGINVQAYILLFTCVDGSGGGMEGLVGPVGRRRSCRAS